MLHLKLCLHTHTQPPKGNRKVCAHRPCPSWEAEAAKPPAASEEGSGGPRRPAGKGTVRAGRCPSPPMRTPPTGTLPQEHGLPGMLWVSHTAVGICQQHLSGAGTSGMRPVRAHTSFSPGKGRRLMKHGEMRKQSRDTAVPLRWAPRRQGGRGAGKGGGCGGHAVLLSLVKIGFHA